MGIHNIYTFGKIAAACLLLAACGGGGGGGSGDNSNNTSTLSLSITDAPVHDAERVDVKFSGVEVKPDNGRALKFSFCEETGNPGSTITIEGECTDDVPSFIDINLLEQTGGASYLLLDRVDVPAGRINWVRLILTDPAGKITLADGAEHPLTVPSGNQTGLKLNRGFDVPEDGDARIVIDFDVRKSVIKANDKYRLKPTLRLVEEFGAITGIVAVALRPATCLGPSIYVYEGTISNPDDIDGDKDDPISSANIDPVTGLYRADFLEPGPYTVAFVCAGGTPTEPADDPEQEDTLSFKQAKPFSTTIVADDMVNVINFPEVIPF